MEGKALEKDKNGAWQTDDLTRQEPDKGRESRFMCLVEHIPDLIYRYELVPKRGFVYVNAAATAMTGYSPEEHYADPDLGFKLVHPDDRPLLLAALHNALPAEQPLTLRWVKKDGSVLWTEQHNVSFHDPDGNLVAIEGIARNVTTRKLAEEALQRSEARLANILNHAAEAVVVINADQQIESINKAAQQLFGYTADELVGEPLDCLIPRRFVETHREQIHRFAASGETKYLKQNRNEVWCLRKDGSEFASEISISSHEESGRKFFTAIISDVTRRRQAEQVLQDKDRILSNAEHIAGSGSWEYDPSTNMVRYSEGMYRLYGISPETFPHTAEAFFSFVHPDEKVSLAQWVRDIQLSQEPNEIDFRIILPDKTIRYIRGRGKAHFNLQGEPVLLSGTAQDITTSRQVETQMNRRVTELEALYQSGLAFSQTLNQKEVGEKIIEVLTGRVNWHHVVVRIRRGVSQEVELLAFSNGNGQRNESIFQSTIMRVGQGMTGWVIEHGQPIRSSHIATDPRYIPSYSGMQSGLYVPIKIADKTIGCISVESDQDEAFTEDDERFLTTLASQAAIALENARLFQSVQRELTERKRAEEELRQLNSELEARVVERTAALSRTNTQLIQAARAKDEFLANMSHELRTPLNAILAFSESLLENIYGPLTERQKTPLNHIETSGRHLLALINDILDLSKVEAGELDVRLESIPLADVCRDSLLFVKESAHKKSIAVNLQMDDPWARVYADAKRLKQILVNLLSNAVKFTPEDGKVTLKVTTDPKQHLIHLAVMDTGIGIAPENLGRLFQPFVQLDARLSREHEGTGLGLALVRRLTELHHGTIAVESELEKGTCFTLTLPYHLFDPVGVQVGSLTYQRVKTGPMHQTRINGTSESVPGTKILLAEDNETNILSVSDYLQSQGYQVAIARNGIETIERASAVRPDLLLMDIQMPGMDGLSAIRQLRSMAGFESVPIIALTALAMPGDRERCLEAGADDYLTKPVSLKRLVKVIDSQLNK